MSTHTPGPMLLPRVIVTRRYNGLVAMQVCAVEDATDAEILEVCNRENLAGTERGWVVVLRTQDPGIKVNVAPIPCADTPGRLHLLVEC